MAAGFNANGDMDMIYVGKTVSHLRRSTEHYSRVLNSTRAEKDESMLYAFAKACSSFFILPAVKFLGDDFKPSQATAEGLLCLLFGSCQLFKVVLTERAKAGLVDLGADVQEANSTLAFDGPSSERKSSEVTNNNWLRYQAVQRLHAQATIVMKDLSLHVANGNITSKDVLDLVTAASIQRQTRKRAYYWRHQSLLKGSYRVRSKDSGLPIFAGTVGVEEVDTKWFLKVSQSSGPTPQDLVICVEEAEVPLWRGLQVEISPQDDPNRKIWAQSGQLLGTTWRTAIESLRLGAPDEAERKRQAREAKRTIEARQAVRRGRLQGFDSLSPVAQAAWDGRLIAGHAFLTYNAEIVAQWGGDREAMIAQMRDLLELDGHDSSLEQDSMMCSFEIVDEAGEGSFRRPTVRGLAAVALPPAAALNRWRLQLLPCDGWQDLGIKLLGKPGVFDIFRELERALVEPCDPTLLEDGSEVQGVDRLEEPECLRSIERTLTFTRNQVTFSLRHDNRLLVPNLTPGALQDLGWDLDAMRTQNDRTVWVKPCLYGATHLCEFHWLVSRDNVEWSEVRQRLPNLVRGRVTNAGSKTAWIHFQEIRREDEVAGRPWADGLRADDLLLDSALV